MYNDIHNDIMAALFTTVQNWKQVEINNNMENI